MSDTSDEKFSVDLPARRRQRPSLFGPILLIAIGAYFLLRNMGVISGDTWNWVALLQLWPLWLIFLGVNVIVRQAPGALGSLLSALVGVVAVAVFGYVLLFSEDNALLNRLKVTGDIEVQRESIEFKGDHVSSAFIDIDFSSPGAEVYALDDSSDLIKGTVSYTGELTFDSRQTGNKANVSLDTSSNNSDFFFFNPASWFSFDEGDQWQIGLSPTVDLELRLDVGSGAVDLDLSKLTLTEVDLIGGSGSVEVFLPDGDYEYMHDSGSGSARVTLGESGRQTLRIEGGSGSMTFYLPDSMEARIEVESGSGSFNIDRDRFSQISGDERDEGVWETAGYDDAPNRVNLTIDVGSGSVSIREP